LFIAYPLSCLSWPFNYSVLRACIGSTDAARRAGTRHAASDTTSKTAGTTVNVIQSVVPMPNNMPRKKRVNKSEAASPRQPSKRQLQCLHENLSEHVVTTCANAMRIPISCVRCRVVYAITP